MGKPTDPDYWKRWRATHSKYRQRQNVLHQKRRILMSVEERTKDRGIPKPKAVLIIESVPPLHTGHDLFNHAQAIACKLVRRDIRAKIYDPLYDDTISEIVVALLEGKSGISAALNYINKEKLWGRVVTTGGDYLSYILNGNEKESTI